MVSTRAYLIYANLAFYFLIMPWCAFWTVLVLCAALLRARPLVKGMLWLWANGVFWILGKKIHLTGMEHVASAKNYLLLINHTSMFDFPAIMAIFPRVAWLGRDNLLKIPVFGQMLTMTDYIAIYPGELEKSKISIETAIQKSSSIHIAMFPEGTRTLDGKLQDFRKGFTYIVQETDLDVLPVTINGLFSWKPKFQRYITPLEEAKIVIQPPVENRRLRAYSRETMATYMKSIINQGFPKEKI